MAERTEQRPPDFSLAEIQGFKNPNLELYRELIASHGEKGMGIPNNDPYAEDWLSKSNKEIVFGRGTTKYQPQFY